ncbi:hypothetical protein F4604DRAFT_2011818 [Suillus subluteus]|nr:hypothetical protein F4604DRAFT_2011818 [Suillus subluteus]
MDFQGDVFGYWGQKIIEDYDDTLLKNIPSLTMTPLEETSQLPVLPKHGYGPPGTVGILGAGVGGLYTALILDSLNIKYEILEASDRTGGRLFTYNFPNGGKYDYYDVGAMRFPLPKKDAQVNYKTGMMRRLGDLINYSKLNKGLSKPPLSSQLIDYHLMSKRQGYFLYFNNQRYQVSQTSHPPDFRAREMGVNSQYITTGVENIVKDIVQPFANELIKDLEQNVHTGWDNMMKHDAYSLCSFMSFKYIPSASLRIPRTHLSTNVINWCETFDVGTGSYDCTLTEMVLEAQAFASVKSQSFGDVEWKCFKGGSQVLTNYMAAYLTANGTNPVIQFNKKVMSISQTGDIAMDVSIRSECIPRTYSHVISTIPLLGLRMIELGGAGLNVRQKNALCKLQYGPSIKTKLFDIIGGQSSTDLPIQTIVYPSYGAESSMPSTVLIVSYCWSNDAECLGALINTGKIEYEEQLKELMLSNLAEDWSDDPLMGANAFFVPGDFQALYTSLTVPNANTRLHFAGEAISTCHTGNVTCRWVVGALDSTWRAVYEYLLASRQHEKIQRFFNLWGKNEEWTGQSKHGKHHPTDLNTMLRVHMGFTYAGELTREGKF